MLSRIFSRTSRYNINNPNVEKGGKGANKEDVPKKCLKLNFNHLVAVSVAACLAGYLYQTISVFETFVGFKLITQKTTLFPGKLYPPGLSFCLFITDIKREDGTFRPDADCSPNEGDTLNPDHCHFNMTTAQILNNTLAFADLIQQVKVKDPQSNLYIKWSYRNVIERFAATRVVEYIKDMRKCFWVKILKESEIDEKLYYRLNDFQYVSPDPMIHLEFKREHMFNRTVYSTEGNQRNGDKDSDKVKPLRFYVHTNHSLPRKKSWFPLVLQTDYSYAATYNRILIYNYENPFIKSCSDSKVSQEKCITECVLGLYSMDFGGRVPANIAVQGADRLIGEDAEKHLFTKCNADCPLPDCVTELLYSRATDTQSIPFEREPENETALDYYYYHTDDEEEEEEELPLPGLSFRLEIRDPETEIKYQVKQDPVEFIVLLASTVGFWFGYSIFSMVAAVLGLLFKKMVRRYRRIADGLDIVPTAPASEEAADHLHIE